MTLNNDEIDSLKQIIYTFSSNLGIEAICLLPYLKNGKDIIFEIDIVYNENESYKDKIVHDCGLLDVPDYDEVDDMISEYIQMYSKSKFDFEKLSSDIYYESDIYSDKSLVSSYILFDRFATFEKLKENMISNGIALFDNVLLIDNIHSLDASTLNFKKQE